LRARAGRKRSPHVKGDRSTGRSRGQRPEDARGVALAARAGPTALDPLAASTAGLLRLRALIAEPQCDLVGWLGGIIRDHARLMGYVIDKLPSQCFDRHIASTAMSDGGIPDEAAEAIKSRYRDTYAALVGAGIRAAMTTTDVALDRLSFEQAELRLDELHAGIAALAGMRRRKVHLQDRPAAHP
jgi:hypothetical protein